MTPYIGRAATRVISVIIRYIWGNNRVVSRAHQFTTILRLLARVSLHQITIWGQEELVNPVGAAGPQKLLLENIGNSLGKVCLSL